MSKGALIILLSALIVLASGVLAYKEYQKKQSGQLSQEATQDETANWKVYRNEKYGFEFRYPADWGINVSEYTPQSDYAKKWKILFNLFLEPQKTLNSRELGSDLPPYLDLTVFIDLSRLDEDKLGVRNLDDFISAYSIDQGKEDALVFEKVERIMLGARSVYRTEVRPRNFGSDINYYIQIDEGIIVISQYGPIASSQEQKKLETALSTFKFF